MATLGGVTEVRSGKQPEMKETNVQKCLTQNAILQITLDGPSIAFTVLGLVATIHLFQPSVTCIIVTLLPLPWIIYNDFQNFLLLGPGGTPPTIGGYIRITYLRLFAIPDPYTPYRASKSLHPRRGLHMCSKSWLPLRPGPRPTVAGIAPHRQLDQPGCLKMDTLLRTTLQSLAKTRPDFFTVGQSCFEKKGLALFARHPINVTCRGEICHVHHSDGSLHLNIHPDDAELVLKNRWGERHPLSRGGWLKQYVPKEFTMAYAPRNVVELQALCRIIEAATYWVSGESIEIDIVTKTTTKADIADQSGVGIKI